MDPWKVEGVTMTSEELVERSSSWTLACDNAVLNKLKTLSEEVHRNSLAIKQDCESLAEDVTRVQARLSNVTNKFLMISNTQFVENRVEEFEEGAGAVAAEASSGTIPKKIKTKQEKEAELLKKMKEAIQIGINTCSTSSFNAGERRRPKMPHLIGSSKFFSSQYVGLHDPIPVSFPNDNLSLDDSVGSNISQPSSRVAVPSNASQEQLGVSTGVSQPSANVHKTSSSFQPPVPYDNYNYAQKTNAYEEPSVIKQPSTTLPQRQSSYPEPTVGRTPMPVPVSSGMGPPPIDQSDESDDDFKPRSSGHGRLFVDDDEDDDLFNDRSLFPPKAQADINSLFFGKNSAEVKPPVSVISPPPYNEKNGDDGVGNQEKDESKPAADNRKLDVGVLPGGRFPNPTISNRATQEAQEKIVNSDSNKSFSSSVKQTDEFNTKSKIPPGAVSVFGKVPPGEFPRFKNNKEKHTSSQQAAKIPDPVTQPGTASTVSGSPKTGYSRSSVSKEVPVNTDEQEHSTSQPSSRSTKVTNHSSQGSLSTGPAKSVLFDSDSDEDLFFSTKKKPTTQSKNPSSLFAKREPLFYEQQNNSKSVNATAGESSKVLKKKSSLFDDSDSGDDLFSSASSSSSKTKQKPLLDTQEDKNPTIRNLNEKTHEAPVKSLGLFGADSDSDSDLFSSLNKKSKSSVSSNTGKAREETVSNKSEIRIMASEESLDIQNSSSSLEQNHHLDMEHEDKDSPNEDITVADGEDNEFKCGEVDSKLSDSMKEESPTINTVSSDESKPPYTLEQVSTPVNTQDATSEEEKVVSPSKIKNSKLKLQFESIVSSPSKKADDMKAFMEKVRPKKPNSASELIAAIKSKIPPDGSEENSARKEVKSAEKKEDGKPAKRSISVKALALGLNLNPLAMKPGAKPPKISSPENSVSSEGSQPASAAETPSLPDCKVSENNNDLKNEEAYKDCSEPQDQVQAKILIVDSESEVKDQLNDQFLGKNNSATLSGAYSTSDEADSTAPLLVNLVKGRPKGQAKRRPPSKKLLKSYANQEEPTQESLDSCDSPSLGHPDVLVKQESVDSCHSRSSEHSGVLVEENAISVDKVELSQGLIEETVVTDAHVHVDENLQTPDGLEPESQKTSLQSELKEQTENQPDDFDRAEPPPLKNDDSDDDQKAVSKGGTIFIDDDEDEDIFNDKSLIPVPEASEIVPESLSSSEANKIKHDSAPPLKQEAGLSDDLKVKKKSSKESSLFDDSDSGDDLFGSSKKTKAGLSTSKSSLRSSKQTSGKSSQKTKSLFEDDSDDDSDLFKPSKLKSKTKQTETNSVADKTGEIVDYGSF